MASKFFRTRNLSFRVFSRVASGFCLAALWPELPPEFLPAHLHDLLHFEMHFLLLSFAMVGEPQSFVSYQCSQGSTPEAFVPLTKASTRRFCRSHDTLNHSFFLAVTTASLCTHLRTKGRGWFTAASLMRSLKHSRVAYELPAARYCKILWCL